MSKFKVGDKVRIIGNDNPTHYYYSGEIVTIKNLEGFSGNSFSCINPEGKVQYVSNKHVELVETLDIQTEKTIEFKSEYLVEFIKTDKKTTMSKIKTFVKNLTLTADEKLLRKHGLKDQDGDFTSEAFDLVEEKIANDNLAYLIEIAKGLEAEEKKSK